MLTLTLVAAALAIVSAVLYVLSVTGALTLDTHVGRRTRALGPVRVSIAAPREVVFDLIALPYVSEQPPRALQDKVTVLERGSDMVLAAHRTKVRLFTAVTLETVRFDRPETVTFRLVRGPVPYVTEEFRLTEASGETELEYRGTLGTDYWFVGQVWGAVVGRTWVRTVQRSLADLKDASERTRLRDG